MRFVIMGTATALFAAASGVSHTAATPALVQNAAAGGVLFKQRCAVCHQIGSGAKPAMGPVLTGVVNRKAAAAAFNYSPKLKASNLRWDRATLDKYLAAPTKLVPGTRMVVGVPDPKQRAAIIAYLASVK